MKDTWEHTDIYQLQEQAIIETLKKLDFNSVLELGCGFGRIISIILGQQEKLDRYVAVDISKHQIEHVKNNFPQVEAICSPIQDLKLKDRFDLVIAVDFLMHVKPRDIEKVLKLMKDTHRKYIVNVDYFPTSGFALSKLAPHNFLHDYPKLYEKVGKEPHKNQYSNLQAIFYSY